MSRILNLDKLTNWLKNRFASRSGLLMDKKEMGKLKGVARRFYDDTKLTCKLRSFGKQPCFGPAFLPDKTWTFGSRQVRRAALFTLNFARLSQQFGGESRRARRIMARASAKNQYQLAKATASNVR